MINHLRGREKTLGSFGWTGRRAEWIALACLHSGVFTRAQWTRFLGCHTEKVRRAVHALVAQNGNPVDRSGGSRRGSYRPVPGPAGRRLRGTLHEGRVGRGGGLGTTGRRIWRASAESPQPLSEAPLRGRPLARLGCALHGQSQPTQCHTLGLARGAPPPFEPPRGPRFGGGRGRGLNPLPGAGIVPGRLAIECLPGGVSHEQPPDCHRRRSSRASR